MGTGPRTDTGAEMRTGTGSARCLLLGLAGGSAADPEGADMTVLDSWQCCWR